MKLACFLFFIFSPFIFLLGENRLKPIFFSIQEGLAQSQIYSMIQDQKGYLWLGTRGGGIDRFDGKKFVHYSNAEGLENGFVNTTNIDFKHVLWVGTDNGLFYLKGNRFKEERVSNYSELKVNAIVFSGNTGWIGCDQGLFQLKNGKWLSRNELLPSTSKSIRSLHLDKNNVLWIASRNLCLKLNTLNLKLIENLSLKFPQLKNDVTCFSDRKNGGVWIGTYGHGAYFFKDDLLHSFDSKKELDHQTIYQIEEKNQFVYFATQRSGVVVYDKNRKKIELLSKKSGVSNLHVRSIFHDKADKLWGGTSGSGLFTLRSKQISHWRLNSELVYCLKQAKNGVLWIGGAQEGLFALKNDQISSVDLKFDYIKIKAITELPSGKLMLASESEGLALFDPSNKQVKWFKSTRKFYFRQMVCTASGKVYAISSGDGLMVFSTDGKVLKRFSSMSKLPARLSALHLLQNENKVIGSDQNGLFLLSKNDQFLTKNALISSKKLGLIRAITSDEKRVFVASNQGVFIFSHQLKFLKQLSVKNGLISNNCYLVHKSKSNHLVIGSEKGVQIVNLSVQLSILKSRSFGVFQDFIGGETCQNSVSESKNGDIYIGTIKGMNMLSKSLLINGKTELSIPTVYVKSVGLFYETVSSQAFRLLPNLKDKILQLNHNENHLSFFFEGVDLRFPSGMMFSYRLKGSENKWSPWSDQSQITYSNLAPGNYQFEVKVKNAAGIIAHNNALLKIEINQAFWQSWWFVFFILLMLLCFLGFIYKQVVKQLLSREEKLRKNAEIQNQLLELEQKALHLQMNPHFIFNALNSIQSMIGTKQEKDARFLIAKFSKLMRYILDHARAKEISIESEISLLENYLVIEQFCSSQKFDFKIHCSDDIEKDFMQIPPMMLQPFVENAIKHGFRSILLDKRFLIELFFSKSDYGIKVIIRDNGIGREQTSKISLLENEMHQSHAMNVIKERLIFFGGSSELLFINDLKGESGASLGTEISIHLPLI